MTATMFILAVLSPLVVALVRRCKWSSDVVQLVAVLVVIVLVVVGKLLDGALTWPIPASFWLDLAAYFGVQQAAYKFAWDKTTVINNLEQVGNYADVH